ncbi:MAG: hypothetical protein N4A74_21910 [Carboxylicivirga sp.]|nr:hypothetical protein [Carboxylicivirga sp.]
MVQNKKYFLIWPLHMEQMPNNKAANASQDLVRLINTYAPHLLIKEKRILPNTSIPIIQRITSAQDYPFKNGQQTQTKGSVVWTDYSIYYWPLQLYLWFIGSNLSLLADEEPEWHEVSEIIRNKGSKQKRVETDELDRWYDEISITHLHPAHYHELYRWFGEGLKEIGYQAFDFFMESRVGEAAWQKAIEKYLENLTGLSDDLRQGLLNNYLKDFIRQ